jgi:hypothetical protein
MLRICVSHTPGGDSDSDKRKSIIDHFMGSMLWWAVNLEGDGYTQGEDSDRDEPQSYMWKLEKVYPFPVGQVQLPVG